MENKSSMSCTTDGSSIDFISDNAKFSVVLSSFPEEDICEVNKTILDSAADSLRYAYGNELMGAVLLCKSVIFNDFPPEIILQYPAILEALLTRVEGKDEIDEEHVWRVQETACKCLFYYGNLLHIRVIDYINLHVMSSEPDDEVSLNQEYQYSIPMWCSMVLEASIRLLSSPHTRLSTAAYQLADITLQIFSKSVNFQTLFSIVSRPSDESINSTPSQLFSLICRVVSRLMYQINEFYSKGDPTSELTLISKGIIKRNMFIIFASFLKMLEDVTNIYLLFDDNETFLYLLHDSCLYHQYPSEYSCTLGTLYRHDKAAYDTFSGFLIGTEQLKSLSKFLQMSSSDFHTFLTEADKCIELLPVHRSRLFVEKLIRGLTKQCSSDSIEDHEQSAALSLLLKLLNCPDEIGQIISFRCVLDHLLDIIGISQNSTNLNESRKCLLFLSESFICCVIFLGFVSECAEVSEISAKILVALIRGEKMMNYEVKAKAFKILSSCLHFLQLVVSSHTIVGLAVLDLLNTLNMHDQVSKFQRLKFHLQSMFSQQSRAVRESGFRNVLAIICTSADDYRGPKLNKISIAVDAHLLIFSTKINIHQPGVRRSNDGSLFIKAIGILTNTSIESNSGNSTAWKDLCSVLRNWEYHKILELEFPFSDIKNSFLSMMKKSNSNTTRIPFVLEIIRRCITFSSFHRSSLADDCNFWIALIKAALFFRENNRITEEIGIIFSLALYDEIILETTELNETHFSLPTLVSKCQYVPFIHQNHSWETPFYSENEQSESMRLQNEVLSREYMLYLKESWNLYFSDDDQNDVTSTPLSMYFSLTTEEEVVLYYKQIKNVAIQLLTDIESSSNHWHVKPRFHQLESVLVHLTHPVLFNMIRKLDWITPVSRFLLVLPLSPLDYQLIFNMCNILFKYLVNLRKHSRKEPNKSNRIKDSLVSLLVKQFSDYDSAMVSVLKKTGTIDWNKNKQSPETNQNVSLFTAILKMINVLLRCHDRVQLDDTEDESGSASLHETIFNVLLEIAKVCAEINTLNLLSAVLLPTLQLMITIVENFTLDNKTTMTCLEVISNLMTAIDRQRRCSRQNFFGKSLMVCLMLILPPLISSSSLAVIKSDSFSLVWDHSCIFMWMFHSLREEDDQLRVAALKVATCFPTANIIAPEESNQLWMKALELFIDVERDSAIRTAACQLLINHTCYLLTDKEENIELHKQVFMNVLTESNYFISTKKIFRYMKCATSDDNPNAGFPANTFASETYATLLTCEESDWVNEVDTDNEDDDSEKLVVHHQLIEACIRLTANCILLDNDRVTHMMKSSLAVNLMARQLVTLEKTISLDDTWCRVITSAFQILILMDDIECSTFLAPLAINAFVSCEHTGSASILSHVSLKMLSSMIRDNSWSRERVLERLEDNKRTFMPCVMIFLHRDVSNEFKQTALCFFIYLCRRESKQYFSYEESLNSFFQSEIEFSGYKLQSIGYELAEHLVQLLPSIEELHQMKWNTNKDENYATVAMLMDLLCNLVVYDDAKKRALLSQEVLRILKASLELLWEKMLTIPITASYTLMNKGIKLHLHFASMGMDLATNLMFLRTKNSRAEFKGRLVAIAELLLPFVHRMWARAVQYSSLLHILLRFLTTASSIPEVCSIFTKTYSLPGLGISYEKTKLSLLACIVLSTCQRMGNNNADKSSQSFSGSQFLQTILPLLLNLTLKRDTSAVIVKEGFVCNALKFLSNVKADKKNDVILKIIQIIASLTSYHEGRVSLERYPNWSKIISTFCRKTAYCEDSLVIFLHMISHSSSTKSMLSSDDEFIMLLADFLPSTMEKVEEFDHPLNLVLACIWALCANNHKAKSIVKRTNLLPVFEFLKCIPFYLDNCNQIINLL